MVVPCPKGPSWKFSVMGLLVLVLITWNNNRFLSEKSPSFSLILSSIPALPPGYSETQASYVTRCSDNTNNFSRFLCCLWDEGSNAGGGLSLLWFCPNLRLWPIFLLPHFHCRIDPSKVLPLPSFWAFAMLSAGVSGLYSPVNKGRYFYLIAWAGICSEFLLFLATVSQSSNTSSCPLHSLHHRVMPVFPFVFVVIVEPELFSFSSFLME